MTSRIRDWQPGKALVVGDVMLDRYWDGSTDRISPEAPVPVVSVAAQSERVGGAANVAANLAALGASVELIGGVGVDGPGERLAALCREHGIAPHFVVDDKNETIVKLRVLSQHQQLLRLDFEQPGTRYDARRIQQTYRASLAGAKIVVLSDYNKGFLVDGNELIRDADRQGIRVIVDPKSSDFSHYRGAYLVTPNFAEFEACVGGCAREEQVIERGVALCREHDIHALLITRGERGMTLLSPNFAAFSLAAKARDVFDVTGAGDTVCAVVAAFLTAGAGLEDSVAYANAAAGLAVGKVGTAIVTRQELDHAMSAQSNSKDRVVSVAELVESVREAQQRGERVVMTNGCFDILHAGHVTYLEHAKALGAKLVVAVNSDASVSRLKGVSRPVNQLQDRMRVLAALTAVDWVVSFAEDDPAALVEAVTPDVLVKGGDYAVEDIVGGAHVLQHGGEVLSLPYVDGASTSTILARLARGQSSESHGQ